MKIILLRKITKVTQIVHRVFNTLIKISNRNMGTLPIGIIIIIIILKIQMLIIVLIIIIVERGI